MLQKNRYLPLSYIPLLFTKHLTSKSTVSLNHWRCYYSRFSKSSSCMESNTIIFATVVIFLFGLSLFITSCQIWVVSIRHIFHILSFICGICPSVCSFIRSQWSTNIVAQTTSIKLGKYQWNVHRIFIFFIVVLLLFLFRKILGFSRSKTWAFRCYK